MLSKIQIGLAPNKNACIKVSEKRTDDVRDELFQNFREGLMHRSNTLQVTFVGGDDDERNYIIMPVDDELKYFEGSVIHKYLGDTNCTETLLRIAKFIVESYGGTLEMVEKSE